MGVSRVCSARLASTSVTAIPLSLSSPQRQVVLTHKDAPECTDQRDRPRPQDAGWAADAPVTARYRGAPRRAGPSSYLPDADRASGPERLLNDPPHRGLRFPLQTS